MDPFLQDLRFACRLLWKDRGFAATAILTLALCIGANAAMFTVVRSVLLRPLAYPEPDRLVYAHDAFPGAGVERAGTSVPNYLDRVPLADVFDSVALYRFRGLDVGEASHTERVTATQVTPSFFRVLGVGAARGRVFSEQEGTVGHNRVAVLSHGYWQRVAGGADAVGRDLPVNGEQYRVIGVMPAEFAFLDPEVDIWVPAVFSDEERSESSRYSQNYDQVARLARGVTLDQAQARLDALTTRNIERAGPLRGLLVNARYHSRVVPLEADVVRNVRGTLQLLWGGVLFVLLIAAVNITNLVLVRATGRLKELATRHAVGASHGRMVRQLLTETMLLTVLGGAAGLALGAAVLRYVGVAGLAELPRGHEIRMDWVVVAATMVGALVLGLIVGVVPIGQLARANLTTVMREDGRTGTAGRGARLVRRLLVTAQVALAFVLLIGAGLLLASFRQLLAVDPGFRATHVLTARTNPPASRYEDDPKLAEFANRTLGRIRALPGVETAGVTSGLPLTEDSDSSVIVAEGYAMAPGESVVSPTFLRVSPGYFEAMGVTLRRGRFFSDSDVAGAPRVIIVDERLAKKFWPSSDPIGRRMYLPDRPEDLLSPGPKAVWLQVVGVVGTVKMQGLVEGEGARVGAYYVPYVQDPSRGVGFAVKTTGDPAALTASIRQVVGEIDPQLSLYDALAMPERVERSLDHRRTPMLLALAFGVVALLLAAVGIYGVLAYQVSQRRREIGIRMSLGSSAASILRLVFREGATFVVIGLAIGLVGAVALRQAIASQLYGVGPLDPLVIASVAGVLGLAAFLACLAPARRASRINPVVALTGR